jgi:hypothetical protein
VALLSNVLPLAVARSDLAPAVGARSGWAGDVGPLRLPVRGPSVRWIDACASSSGLTTTTVAPQRWAKLISRVAG